MSRKCLIISIMTVALLITAAGVIFADHFSLLQGIRKPPVLLKKFILPRAHNHPDRYRMPTLRPDPMVEYKILTMKTDESIDYKILDAAPHETLRRHTVSPRVKKFKLSELHQRKLWHKPYALNLKKSPLKNELHDKNR